MAPSTSGKIEITNLYSTDEDFNLTLTVMNVGQDNISPWSDFIKLNQYNVKFRIYHHISYYTLYCYVLKTGTSDKIGIQDELLISIKLGDVCAQTNITSFDTEKEVGTVRSPDVESFFICGSVTQSYGSLKTMYYDESLLDYKLAVKGSSEGSGENSVGFHRTVLAAWSPVMLNMFNNSWKEKNEGVFELPVKVEVIKALKKYVYTEELPEDKETLLGLAELGSYFMNPKLEINASRRIIKLISPGDIWDTIMYSGMKQTNNLTRLLLMKVHNSGRAELDEVIDEIAKL